MYSKLFKFIKKLVALSTAFCGGAALVFVISGAGEPLIRLLVFIIFFVSAINLGIYAKEMWEEKKKKPSPGGQGKPGGGGGQGGGDRGGNPNGGDRQGGDRQGGGRPGGGPR